MNLMMQRLLCHCNVRKKLIDKLLLTKAVTSLILDLIILKGSTDMYLFATTTTYTSNQTMQNNWYGLNVVCKYFGYEEK